MNYWNILMNLRKMPSNSSGSGGSSSMSFCTQITCFHYFGTTSQLLHVKLKVVIAQVNDF